MEDVDNDLRGEGSQLLANSSSSFMYLVDDAQDDVDDHPVARSVDSFHALLSAHLAKAHEDSLASLEKLPN
jgi:hypothetical protein